MQKPDFKRHSLNPIVRPGTYDWRMAVTFNPGVVKVNDRFYLYERAAGQLQPFQCAIGLLSSEDGVHFHHVKPEPVLTPASLGSPHGSVQDPRLVYMEDTFYMTYAFRPYAWNCCPTGLGIPRSEQASYPGFDGDPQKNLTRSGLATSQDGIEWRHDFRLTDARIDDRDVVLFPEKINNQYVLLRRPLPFVGPDVKPEKASIYISYSTDMQHWSEPDLLVEPRFDWEGTRIGAATPPLKTPTGWLLFYHGVEEVRPANRGVVYRLGALLLDLDDPSIVLARSPHWIMEPETYYETTGLYIPNVIFPTGAVMMDDVYFIYYGCCDTAIALAQVHADELLDFLIQFKV